MRNLGPFCSSRRVSGSRSIVHNTYRALGHGGRFLVYGLLLAPHKLLKLETENASSHLNQRRSSTAFVSLNQTLFAPLWQPGNRISAIGRVGYTARRRLNPSVFSAQSPFRLIWRVPSKHTAQYMCCIASNLVSRSLVQSYNVWHRSLISGQRTRGYDTTTSLHHGRFPHAARSS